MLSSGFFGGSGRKLAGKFIVRAAGESSAEVATELPEIVKKIQDAVSVSCSYSVCVLFSTLEISTDLF